MGGRSVGAVVGRRAPSLRGLDGWQQSAPRSLSMHRGQVVVVWFFTVSSPTCLAMVPGLRDLQQAHGEDVAVIGVHSPDYARDADPRALGRRVAVAGMTWPVAMDHRRTVFSRWQEGHDPSGWPFTAVLGRDGRVGAVHVGGDVAAIAADVARLTAVR